MDDKVYVVWRVTAGRKSLEAIYREKEEAKKAADFLTYQSYDGDCEDTEFSVEGVIVI